MTTQITCPVEFADQLFLPETLNALRASLTPLTDEGEGDLMALCVDFQLTVTSNQPHAMSGPDFMVSQGGLIKNLCYRVFRTDAAEPHFGADAMMMATSDFIIPKAIQSTLEKLDPENGENFYASALITREAIFVTWSEIANAIECHTDDECADEDNIDRLAGLVLPKLESAHQRMELAGRLPQLMKLINRYLELPDFDGNPIELTAPRVA